MEMEVVPHSVSQVLSQFFRHADPDNTRTPLIAWGSGIRHPLQSKSPSIAWNLTIKGHDVSQADIAPLMSTLLGRNLPSNSVGVLPDVYAYMGGGEETPGYLNSSGGDLMKARAAVVNAKVSFSAIVMVMGCCR